MGERAAAPGLVRYVRKNECACPGSCSFPPICTCCGATVCRCQQAQQTRGIRRGLYVERLIVGTHQVQAIRKQVPHWKKLPPNFILMLGPTGLSTLVNKRNKFPTMIVIGALFFKGIGDLLFIFCCCGKGISGI